MNCKRCGRELKNPVSVKNEMGPVCYGKAKMEEKQKDLFEAEYEVVRVGPVGILIRDIGKGRSVTNDAERVVKEIMNTYEFTVPNEEVMIRYIDTMDRTDILKVSAAGEFAGFAPGVPA